MRFLSTLLIVLFSGHAAAQPVDTTSTYVHTFNDCIVVTDLLHYIVHARDNENIRFTKDMAVDVALREADAQSKRPFGEQWLFIVTPETQLFTISHIEKVFDNPRPIDEHLTDILMECITQIQY